jgi:hypothetical protein
MVRVYPVKEEGDWGLYVEKGARSADHGSNSGFV